MRRTSAGGINFPHFGHTASSDARTFSRLIFRARGMARPILIRDRNDAELQCGSPERRSGRCIIERMVGRKKIDLAKVLGSLNITCPLCGYSIPPNEVVRLGMDLNPLPELREGVPSWK
jgi:hypothetical protein